LLKKQSTRLELNPDAAKVAVCGSVHSLGSRIVLALLEKHSTRLQLNPDAAKVTVSGSAMQAAFPLPFSTKTISGGDSWQGKVLVHWVRIRGSGSDTANVPSD
jgi:hypothetical protein